jgi:hypothetical protein
MGCQVTQRARNLASSPHERKHPPHGSSSTTPGPKYWGPFDEALRMEGIEVIRTPIRAASERLR